MDPESQETRDETEVVGDEVEDVDEPVSLSPLHPRYRDDTCAVVPVKSLDTCVTCVRSEVHG